MVEHGDGPRSLPAGPPNWVEAGHAPRMAFGAKPGASLVGAVAGNGGASRAQGTQGEEGMERHETIRRLRQALEHAPPAGGSSPSKVKGWIVDGVEVCDHCAGRILARGCRLGEDPTPLWDREVTCEIH